MFGVYDSHLPLASTCCKLPGTLALFAVLVLVRPSTIKIFSTIPFILSSPMWEKILGPLSLPRSASDGKLGTRLPCVQIMQSRNQTLEFFFHGEVGTGGVERGYRLVTYSKLTTRISTQKHSLTFSSLLPLLVVWSLSDVGTRFIPPQRTQVFTKSRYHLIPPAFYEEIGSKNTASEVTPTWKLALSDVRKIKWRAILCARVCEHARPRITSPTPRFKAGWQTIIHPWNSNI